MSNAPAKKFRIGYVTATVWKNDGTTTPFYTVEVARTYKDADDRLQNTSSLGHADILPAMKCLERAEAWIAAQ
jgi:hypothetical protein